MLPRRHTPPPLYVVFYGQHKLQLLVDTHIYTHTHTQHMHKHPREVDISSPFRLVRFVCFFFFFFFFFLNRYQIKLSRDGVEEGEENMCKI